MLRAAPHSGFEIRVFENDVGALATKLLRHALDGLRSPLGDIDARTVDPVNEIMSRPACALIAAPTSGPCPVHEIEHALGHTRFHQDLGKNDRTRRREFGRLSTIVQPAARAAQSCWPSGSSANSRA